VVLLGAGVVDGGDCRPAHLDSITRPLVAWPTHSTAVAADIDTRLPEGNRRNRRPGRHSTAWSKRLQEGLIYHDLLGRAVTPEVRVQRSTGRQGSGGERAIGRATVLVAGLRRSALETAPPIRRR
jgi:hypothetical protein